MTYIIQPKPKKMIIEKTPSLRKFCKSEGMQEVSPCLHNVTVALLDIIPTTKHVNKARPLFFKKSDMDKTSRQILVLAFALADAYRKQNADSMCVVSAKDLKETKGIIKQLLEKNKTR